MRKDDDAKEGGIKAKAKGDEGRGAVGAVAKVMEGVVVVAMVAKVMEGVVVVAKVMNGVCIGECFGVRTTRPKSSEQEIVVLAVATVFVRATKTAPTEHPRGWPPREVDQIRAILRKALRLEE